MNGETPAERAEKAAIRRRWISLAEWVGIAALLVSAAGLWMSWSDRTAAASLVSSGSVLSSRPTWSPRSDSGTSVCLE